MEERKMNQRSKLYTNILQNVKKSPPPPKKKPNLLEKKRRKKKEEWKEKKNKSIDVSGNL